MISPFYESADGTVKLFLGKCEDVMAELEADSFHSVCTDPPYEISFMGVEFDSTGIAHSKDMWRQVLRVVCPGAHILSFAATRTYHRMACAIEDAGFECRDCISWLYGQGFPHALDVSKEIDKKQGTLGEIIKEHGGTFGINKTRKEQGYRPGDVTPGVTRAPGSAEAEAWVGWKTSLKPAQELLCLARKPFKGSVAANVLKYGTSALNIDACRIEGEMDGTWGTSNATVNPDRKFNSSPEMTEYRSSAHDLGRYPSNVILDGRTVHVLRLTDGLDAHARQPIEEYFGNYTLPRMRKRDCDLCQQTEEWSGTPLQPGVLCEVDDAKDGHSIASVRDSAHARSYSEDDGHQASDRTEGQGPSNVQGCVHESRVSHDQCVRSQGKATGTRDADGAEGTSRNCGASIDYGDDPRSAATSERDCSSPQRSQVGQSPIESTPERQQRPQEEPQGDTGRIEGYAAPVRTTPSLSGVVVACDDVPEPWLKYFEDTGYLCESRHSASSILDEQSGILTSGASPKKRNSDKFRNVYGEFKGGECLLDRPAESGGASRFFYVAKPSKAEKNAGLEHMEPRQKVFNGQSRESSAEMKDLEARFTTQPMPNDHVSVKPIKLMRYLCRLVTPPGGIILDPFCGSGSTLVAAVHEGFSAVGIDMDPHYLEIAAGRIEHAFKERGKIEPPRKAASRSIEQATDSEQGRLAL